MNNKKVIKDLKKKYPGKKVLEGNGEIICEIKPVSEDPKVSIAIAVIDKTAPHVHKVTTETYEVIKGKLSLFVDGKEHLLEKGETLTIKPNQKHYAVGNETWIKCTSHPGWTFEDHILLKDK